MDVRTVKPVNTALDWTVHMKSSANHFTGIPVRNPYNCKQGNIVLNCMRDKDHIYALFS